MMRLGFHLSISGGVYNAPIEAASMDYNAFQIFTTSSRSWKNSGISDADAGEFMRYTKENDLKPFAHMPYLCNPASPNRQVHEKSTAMLVDNIMNCSALGIGGLVIHLGSHLGKGMDEGIRKVCDTLDSALGSTAAEKNVDILLENGSGYTNCVGSKISDIGRIIDNVGSDRVGVCFDTCHAFAAGYDISDEASVDKIVKEFKSSIKQSRLGLVHLNDAMYPLGSGRDRHQHIGKGYIGTGGFTSLFRNGMFGSGSFVMELPEDPGADHQTDMNAVKSILKGIHH